MGVFDGSTGEMMIVVVVLVSLFVLAMVLGR
jgi:hypothetical protein